jgi:hypothetical protein
MRKITEKMKRAFDKRMAFNGNNTKVKIEDGKISVYLFNNKIVEKDKSNNTFITVAGYPTVTTIERLNAFIPLRKRKGELYTFNRSKLVKWDGNWTNLEHLKNEHS